MKRLIITVFLASTVSSYTFSQAAKAENVEKELRADANRAAGMLYVRSTAKKPKDTPAPNGKKPFYINHYGSPGAYYLEKPNYYMQPYTDLAKADSLGKLTKLGKDVKQRIETLMAEAHNRYGELSEKGDQQSRSLMKQMVERFPDMFTSKGYFSARSIVSNRCILSMYDALLQLSAMRQPIVLRSKASHQEDIFMNPSDDLLTSQRMDSVTYAHYHRFSILNGNATRLMASLFNDQNYVISNIDATALSRRLFRLACSIQSTSLTDITLFDIFTPEEIHQHWRRLNAFDYINYGGCTLNGSYQPYLQRVTLRNMIHTGDSVLRRNNPLVHLKYTNENVVMSLACLMELDGYGLQTSNLDSLEAYGWANYRIAPLGGSIEMIHYRANHDDSDVLVKVLLNGHEAKLPIETDCAPYYHWNDVKQYYLRKLYRYENRRFSLKKK